MALDADLIDTLLAEYKKPEDVIGENGLLKQLTKALLERAMDSRVEGLPAATRSTIQRDITAATRETERVAKS